MRCHKVRRSRGAFVAVALLMTIAALYPYIAHAAVAETPFLERPVCSAFYTQTVPGISGTRVVWEDDRNGSPDIYVYDLVSDTETRLTDEAARQANPEISGTRLVWEDDRNGDYDIYAYDLTSGVETRITDEAVVQIHPAVSGPRVVWQDMRNGDNDIYLYDLASGVETRITDETADQRYPAISGMRIVWMDNRNGNWDIYLHDLASGVETRVTDNGATQQFPAISGTRVTWEDRRNGNADIYAYDLATGVETRITDESADQRWPDIADSRVVWQDYRTGEWDVYIYDLASGVETRVREETAFQEYPAISGTRFVWQDVRTGTLDIYLAELLLPQATLSAPAVVAHGAQASVRAKLTSALDMSLAGRALLLRASPDNEHWQDVAVGLTDALGRASFVTPPLYARTYLRAVFAGDEFYPAAEGAAVAVKPRALLGTPSTPSSMYTTRTYTVSGTLKPPHPAGSKLVSLRCYRYEAGHWRLKKSVAATLSDYPGHSRYHARVRLPLAGSWQLCAYHADADHATTRSGWRYVGVR